MRHHAESTCDQHPDRFDCADCLIHRRSDGLYGIIIHDGGSATCILKFCPWCGISLPTDEDDLSAPDGSPMR